MRCGVLMSVLASLALASTSLALELRYTAPACGQIRSESGVPASDGQYSVSFGVWTDSTGGTMIWSDTQVVIVTGGQGLFNTQLNLQPYGGGITIHNADRELFLETTVEGEALSPRMRLGHAIRAVVSTGVYHVDSGDGSLLMAVGDDTTSMGATREGPGALIESTMNLTDDRGLLGLRAYEPGGPGSSSLTEGTTDSVREFHGIDMDGDGMFEGTNWEKVDNTDGVVDASSSVAVDIDDDGVADAGILWQAATEDVAARAAGDAASLPKVPRSVLKSFFATGTMPTSEITHSIDRAGPVLLATSHQDTDGNGSVDRVSLTPESAVVLTETYDPTGSSSSQMRTRPNQLETILKSIGLLETSSVRQSLSPESAVVSADVTHPDGSSSYNMRTRIDQLEQKLQAIGLLARSGNTQSTTPESSSVRLETYTGPAALPPNTATMGSDTHGARVFAEAAARNIGLYVSEVTGQCDLVMTDASQGAPETTIVIDGVSRKVGIGVSQPSHAIDHFSGARLTDAGAFVNASDANLKENFQQVDGARLLAQLERLPISRWNYKAESDEITHIGPTAQDFQAAFHLGADDRSISTIDPSGVALAAIQELNRKLENENLSLRQELNELKKQVEKLAASR